MRNLIYRRDQSLVDLLTARSSAALGNRRIDTVGDLLESGLTKQQLLCIDNIGQKSANEIMDLFFELSCDVKCSKNVERAIEEAWEKNR